MKLARQKGGEYLKKHLKYCVKICFATIMFIAKSNVTGNLSSIIIYEPKRSKNVEEYFLNQDD